MKNKLKEALKRGEVVVGAFVGFPSPVMIEFAGYAGFDFVIIDTEHGPLGIESTESLVIAAEAAGIVPVVRVTLNDQAMIMQALDVGAQGVQIPQVNTKEDAFRAIQHSKFPPLGARGLALSVRASKFGIVGVQEFIRYNNEEGLVILHIENVKGIENLSEILTVEGIDVIFVGPVDLSQSLGTPGEFGNKEFLFAMDKVINQASAAGKVLGTFVGNPEDARKWIDRGVQYICAGSTGLINKACRDFVREVKNIGA